MRILIVEDEPAIAASISAALGASGYQTRTAVDGEEAWFLGDTEAFDLVVLDLGLPGMDGLAVLKRWRSAGRQMPVMIDGANVAVSPLEYRLIAYLLHHKGRVVSPGELIEHLYGDDDARDANALEAVITRLRKKLGADVVQTRRGFGYVIGAESE